MQSVRSILREVSPPPSPAAAAEHSPTSPLLCSSNVPNHYTPIIPGDASLPTAPPGGLRRTPPGTRCAGGGEARRPRSPPVLRAPSLRQWMTSEAVAKPFHSARNPRIFCLRFSSFWTNFFRYFHSHALVSRKNYLVSQ